jgi:regulator of protease activity HflC (stomatin/prohibitin superfamily)
MTGPRDIPALLWTGLTYAVLGLLLIAACASQEEGIWLIPITLPAGLTTVGSALLIGAAGLLSSAFVTAIRQRAIVARERAATPNEPVAGVHAAVLQFLGRAEPSPAPEPKPSTTPAARLPQVSVTALAGLLALLGAIPGLQLTAVASAAPVPLTPDTELATGIALVIVAFPVLVSERIYAHLAEATFPEAPQLERLLRVPLAVLLAVGLSEILAALGLGAAFWIAWVSALLVVAVAAELLLRAAATLFLPPPPIDKARSVADSTLAGLIRPTVPSFRTVNRALEEQFGIDLARSWALDFMRRTSLPFVFLLALAAWGLTGITSLGLSERGIYERFGAPVEVLGPGLHVHLPWPLGTIRRVDLGVLHDIPIGMPPVVGARVPASLTIVPTSAEAVPPASADRLWDQPHPSEQSYLVASAERGKQTFELVDIEMRLIYRVGLSDSAALKAAYAVVNQSELIRAAASRLLARYFASHTLLGVLTDNRETFTNEFRTALQTELDRLGTGIDAVAVVVEAIHPPQGAAAAYHDVQAAEIRALATIAAKRGNAAEARERAAQKATEARNAALTTGTEATTRAVTDSRLFEADSAAYERDRDCFLFERWLERLSRGLAHKRLLVVDHRLTGAEAPTLDFRQFGAPAAPQP